MVEPVERCLAVRRAAELAGDHHQGIVQIELVGVGLARSIDLLGQGAQGMDVVERRQLEVIAMSIVTAAEAGPQPGVDAQHVAGRLLAPQQAGRSAEAGRGRRGPRQL
ncbi:MAG: hypothetical protein AB1Z98_13940, partial [Nannocystaceae bacterium]